MSLSPNISQREYDKFAQGSGGETLVQVKVMEDSSPGAGASQADKSAFVEGTTEFNPIGGVFNDSISSDPTEDQAAAARITAKRGLHVNLRDSSGNEHIGQELMDASIPVAIASNQSAVPVSAASLPLPSGASTLAEQQTQTTSLQLIDDVVHSPNSAISKTVALGAQLDDTGTATVTENNIGTLRINSSRALHVEVRDSASQVPLNTYFTELTAGVYGPGDLSDRFYAMAGEDDADRIRALQVDTDHNLKVAIFQPDSGGVAYDLATAANQATQITALQLIDDIAHAANASLSKGVPMMGQLDDTGTATVTENNVGMARITGARGIHVNLRNNSGTEVGNSVANALFTKPSDGSGLSNLPITVANVSGFGIPLNIATDAGLNFQTFTSVGESRVLAASTNNTLANARYIKTETDGTVHITDNGNLKASYSVSTTGLAVAAAATDIWEITGSATKTIKITQLWVTGIATTATTTDVQLIKRSTANSGGTSTATVFVAHDSSDAAATATGKAYTANPTLGTAVGTIRSIKTTFPLTGAAVTMAQWDFGVRPAKPIYLRGTSQQLCVNLNGATVTGGSLNIWAEITEES